MAISSFKLKKILLRVLLHLFLITLGLLFIIPFLWMVFSSFKSAQEILSLDFNFLPIKWTLENYQQVLSEQSIARPYINSIIVSGSTTLLVMLTAGLAGYLFGKLRFRGRELLFNIVIISMMIPPQLGILALYMLATEVGFLNSYQGLVFPFMMSAFGIFLVRQFIVQLPDSLIDAAKIDGANDFGVFKSIIFPLIIPSLSIVGILTFAWNWDQLIWPLVIVNTNEMKTLPLVFSRYIGSIANQYGPAMSSATLMVIPVIIVFLIFQRNLIKVMSNAGIKG